MPTSSQSLFPDAPPPRIARVVVDLALDREFDYAVPPKMHFTLQVGDQVEVPFGRNVKQGFVVGFVDESPYDKLKSIRKVLHAGLIAPPILKLARWMAEYYACAFEQVIKTVLPGAVRKSGAAHREQLYAIPTEKATESKTLSALRIKAPKQAAVIDLLLAGDAVPAAEVVKSAGATHAALKSLESKGLITLSKQPMLRDPLADAEYLPTKPHDLSLEQEKAMIAVRQSIDTGTPPVILLFGVTGSGKTEIYLQGISHALAQGKTCIMLVPEISLTPQTVERFRGRFGKRIAVLHSHLSDGERFDEWSRIEKGDAEIVVGARSALFAPLKNLGLIVVDEEHESSYKQQESPPYNARDLAVVRGKMEGCSVLLGSATPAVESFHNAQLGKYTAIRCAPGGTSYSHCNFDIPWPAHRPDKRARWKNPGG